MINPYDKIDFDFFDIVTRDDVFCCILQVEDL